MVFTVKQRQVTCWIDGQEVQVLNLSAESEREQVRSLHSVAPNLAWEHTDTRGHFHAYAEGGKTPTLVRVETEPYWCPDCNDEHTDYVTRCSLCGEDVTPGTVDRGPKTEWIEGPTTWEMWVTGLDGFSHDPLSVRLIDKDVSREVFGVMHVANRRAEFGRPTETQLMGWLAPRARKK